MAYEMYNDGLYFCEQAMIEDTWGDKNRCYRFAIVSFASSFEAFINLFIKKKLEEEKNKIVNGEEIYNFLEGAANRKPKELANIYNKVTLLEKLYDIEKDNLIESQEFKRFKDEIIDIRNKIVHYSYGNFSVIYADKISNAAFNGAKLLRDL